MVACRLTWSGEELRILRPDQQAAERESEPQSTPSDTSSNKDTPFNSATPYKPMGPFLLKPQHYVNF